MSGKGIGASVHRKDDGRFVRGRGAYVADMVRPGMASVPSSAGPMPMPSSPASTWPAPRPCRASSRCSRGRLPPHPALAVGKVRYGGDALAFVVAAQAASARDAAVAVAIAVSHAALATLIDLAGAIAFARAAHVARVQFLDNRLVGNPTEPRAIIAEHDAATGRTTLRTTSRFGAPVAGMSRRSRVTASGTWTCRQASTAHGLRSRLPADEDQDGALTHINAGRRAHVL